MNKNKSRYDLSVSDDNNYLIHWVNQLLELGIKNKIEMMVMARTSKPSEFQITCYKDGGQAKVRFIPDQRRIGMAFRARLKMLAHMDISRRDIWQEGQIVHKITKGSKSKDITILVTATPTKYGEVIILTF